MHASIILLFITELFKFTNRFLRPQGWGGAVVLERGVIELTVCSNEEQTLETSSIHQTSQAKNKPYQPLLIKPTFSLLTNEEKTFFFKLVYQYLTKHCRVTFQFTSFLGVINFIERCSSVVFILINKSILKTKIESTIDHHQ